MFIRYQKVRNTILGTVAAIGGTVGAIFGYQSIQKSDSAIIATHGAEGTWEDPVSTPPSAGAPKAVRNQTQTAQPARSVNNRFTANNPSATFQQPQHSAPTRQQGNGQTLNQRYANAMKFANSKSNRSGKAKDLLGSSNPWKLNLYDDNLDGTWDRAKLDTNRDEVEDEKWTYKNGRWEKENGRLVWSGKKWQKASDLAQANSRATDPTLARYREAMKIAMSRSNRAAKGKDVLGASSPWKLNVYDDNQDGVWDRAKLDTNRDEVDDEKWTFKNGRWEKNDGKLVWSDRSWKSAATVAATAASSVDPKLARYREAFKIANARADRSGKGKDVLGRKSPWKLNLYDDDRDGVWDRGKLDTNRDEVADEKWNFKNGRWSRDSGQTIWTGQSWKPAAAMAKAISQASNPNLIRYRNAMKIATGRANRTGKGKDVLGSRSPWKLNLYDDDRDGVWDRGKLDTNRDEVADEKWNYKQGRWEKEGGAKIWDGENWISN